MSSPVSSSLVKDGAIGRVHCKRPRKKRSRNKFKNSSFRKKKFKKFDFTKTANSFEINSSKSNLGCEKIMSNWYWSNYKKAIEWQNKHQIAHWKSTALALLEENRYLLQIISNTQPDMVPTVSCTQSNIGRRNYFNKSKVNPSDDFVDLSGSSNHNDGAEEEEEEEVEDDDDDDDDEIVECDEEENVSEDFEFEMSEEMMQFFVQSYKHKMELEKLKNKELISNTDKEIQQIKTNKLKRTQEMNTLYGDGASMITGMETAVQLSFDKYCDIKSPKYWPNIPFRL